MRNNAPKTTPINIEKLVQLSGRWNPIRIHLELVCHHGDGHESGHGWALESFTISEFWEKGGPEPEDGAPPSVTFSPQSYVVIDNLRTWLSTFDDELVKMLLNLERGQKEWQRPIARAFMEIDSELEKLKEIPISQ